MAFKHNGDNIIVCVLLLDTSIHILTRGIQYLGSEHHMLSIELHLRNIQAAWIWKKHIGQYKKSAMMYIEKQKRQRKTFKKTVCNYTKKRLAIKQKIFYNAHKLNKRKERLDVELQIAWKDLTN